MSPGRVDATVETILNDLYASELNCEVRSLWDGGFDVAMRDYMNGYIVSKTGLRSWREIADWLTKMALRYYPQSEFADNTGLQVRSEARKKRDWQSDQLLGQAPFGRQGGPPLKRAVLRLAAGRDLERNQQAAKENGGEW